HLDQADGDPDLEPDFDGEDDGDAEPDSDFADEFAEPAIRAYHRRRIRETRCDYVPDRWRGNLRIGFAHYRMRPRPKPNITIGAPRWPPR
ncbi:hypothetical protein ABI055_14625, partial [Enterococcus faecium]|uniref:hypothetical protein n=1 Tax=Enterococcus faecium TaxID=1352 RepID=UPI003F429DF7